MKLSSLLLSSAAVIVAGSAFAADLPAKKAAPAAAPAVASCPSFGKGFFTIPGSDTCLQFSGRMLGDVTVVDPKGSRSTAPATIGASWRIAVDARSNTDAGVVRGFARTSGGSGGKMGVDYAYAQIGGLTAGLADTAFATINNPWGWEYGADDGAVLPVLQYTASIGTGNSITIGVENAANRTNTSDTGAAQIPDLVGQFKSVQGPVTFQLAAATHQNHGSVSGDKQGYAVNGAVTFAATKDTTVYVQAAYADAALSYLGYGFGKDAFGTGVPGYDYTDTAVTKTAKGWSAQGVVNQAVGAGSISLNGAYGVITDINSKDAKITQIELNYDYTGIKGVQIVPAIYYKNTDYNGTSANSTTGYLRIERDF